MSPLRVEGSMETVQARADPAPVEVIVTNVSEAPVRINRRLAPGYRDALSREVWTEVRDESGAEAAVSTIDYERDFPGPEDYGELAPGESVSRGFDLFHYARPQRPGRYTITIVYQADEPAANPPDGVVEGEHAAEPITILVS